MQKDSRKLRITLYPPATKIKGVQEGVAYKNQMKDFFSKVYIKKENM